MPAQLPPILQRKLIVFELSPIKNVFARVAVMMIIIIMKLFLEL